MRALVYHGPGEKAWEDVPNPQLVDDTDAIVRVDAVTICGSDLHILKGDVPAVTPGRILGHEAVGTVERTATRKVQVHIRAIWDTTHYNQNTQSSDQNDRQGTWLYYRLD